MSRASRPKATKLQKIDEKTTDNLIIDGIEPVQGEPFTLVFDDKNLGTVLLSDIEPLQGHIAEAKWITSDQLYVNKKHIELMNKLNEPETKCRFWMDYNLFPVNDVYNHLVGIRPVKRTTVEMINENGFNPFKKETDETFFRVYIIDVLEEEFIGSEPREIINERIRLEELGYTYIRHHDIDYIYNFIRKHS